MDFTDKDGNTIDTSGVDEKLLGVVGKIIGGEIHRVSASIGDTVTAAVNTAVEAQVAPLAEQVETLAKAPPKEGSDNPGAEPKGGVAEAVAAAMAPVMEKLNALTTEREQERAASTSRQVAEAFIKQHRPNLRGKDVLLERIAGAGVKTEEDARKVSDAWDAEMKRVLSDEQFKALTADPQNEGARETPSGEDAQKGEAKEKLLKQIRERRPVATSVA